ncbi:hypothetical protein E2C01_006857 [Portunus trituberculatus]|uniref:Uncharacterized protein n=1 Tax=Portunus trituberculatus TaxID=210409 RepID=A0A5B7CZA3_PORTR|nr:hypothetical protein [Portunus trituberculatus]
MGDLAVIGQAPVMAGDPVDEVMVNGMASESKENVEGLINGVVELTERVKRRAKRPSKFMTKELSRANSDTQVIAPLRALKNSRKSRNGFGRGLPKKVTARPAAHSSVLSWHSSILARLHYLLISQPIRSSFPFPEYRLSHPSV